MADAGNGEAVRIGGGGQPPSLGVMSQYVKDLSFENPGGAASLRPRQKAPNLNITIGVQPNQISPTDYEVEIKIDAKATDGDTTLFVIELVYAGAFRFTNVPPEEINPITMIECPRILFPFARQVLASTSSNGGFPPLLLDPIDFAALYRQRQAAQQDQRPRAV